MVLVLAQRYGGRVARTIFFEYMLRVRCRAQVKSFEYVAEPLPWNDSYHTNFNDGRVFETRSTNKLRESSSGHHTEK